MPSPRPPVIKRKTRDECLVTTIRVPKIAHARLHEAAAAERRSLSNYLITSALIRADELLGPEKK